MPLAASIFAQTKYYHHLETASLNTSKLSRGHSPLSKSETAFAKQGGTTGTNSRPYNREGEFFYLG